jgi:hypothetical protein
MLLSPMFCILALVMAIRTAPDMTWIIAIGITAILGSVIVIMSLVMPKFKIFQKLIDKKGVGVYYRIPESVELSIELGGRKYYKSTQISQFGVVSYMMDSPNKIIFKHQTGALKFVE